MRSVLIKALVGKIKELVHEGHIRRVVIKGKYGKVLVDIPLTAGVAGVLILPQVAVIGAIAAWSLKPPSSSKRSKVRNRKDPHGGIY